MTDPQKFGDFALTLRVRDALRYLTLKFLEDERPAPKVGRVVRMNRGTRNAFVLLTNDTVPTPVKCLRGIQPSRTDETHGDGNGDLVRIEGTPRNYWVTAVLSGGAYTEDGGLFNPRLFGGLTKSTSVGRYFAVESNGLPALNNAWIMGRWRNSGASTGRVGLATIDVVVSQGFQTSITKSYRVAVTELATGEATMKLFPDTSTGPIGGHDFELEIVTFDGDDIQLQVRRTADGGGLSPGNYVLQAWFYGDGWEPGDATTDFPNEETTDPAPGEGIALGWFALPLASGWTPYGAPFRAPRYKRIPGGRVELTGLVQNTSGVTKASPSTVSTLPAGYRPKTQLIFGQPHSTGFARIDVTAAGLLSLQVATLDNGWISLDGMTFTADW